MPSQLFSPAAHASASRACRSALRHMATVVQRQLERSYRGQTTAEYGLVILAAGTLALAAILWARSSGSITSLFDTVITTLTGDI